MSFALTYYKSKAHFHRFYYSNGRTFCCLCIKKALLSLDSSAFFMFHQGNPESI